MEVSGSLNALAALRLGKEIPVPTGLVAGWAPDLVLTLGRK